MFWAAVAADGVVVVHLLFILFAVLGGILVWRWRGFGVLQGSCRVSRFFMQPFSVPVAPSRGSV